MAYLAWVGKLMNEKPGTSVNKVAARTAYSADMLGPALSGAFIVPVDRAQMILVRAIESLRVCENLQTTPVSPPVTLVLQEMLYEVQLKM